MRADGHTGRRPHHRAVDRTAGLYLFSDFHESLLDELDHPGAGIGVDLDPREQILIPPVMHSRGPAAQLDLYAPAHQARDQLLVGIPAADVAFGVVSLSCSVTWPASVWKIATTSDVAPQSAMSLVRAQPEPTSARIVPKYSGGSHRPRKHSAGGPTALPIRGTLL